MVRKINALGECGNKFATYGVSLAVKPTFVTGSQEAPAEWHAVANNPTKN
jgi:uncharacterized protein (DUF2126 family)